MAIWFAPGSHQGIQAELRADDTADVENFSEKQIEILMSDKWNKFIRNSYDVILFSDLFFDADIDELRELKNDLENAI